MLDKISTKAIICVMVLVVALGAGGIFWLLRDAPADVLDEGTPTADVPHADLVLLNAPDGVGELTLTIHVFERLPHHPGGWDFWVWTPDGTPGGIIGGGGGRHSADVWIQSPFTQEYYLFRSLTLNLQAGTDRVGFLMRLPPTPTGGWDDWGRQTGDVIAFLDTDGEGNPVSSTVFHIQGTNMVTPTFPYMGGLAVTAIADWRDYIRVTLLEPEGEINLADFEVRDVTGTTWENGTVVPIRSVEQGASRIGAGSAFPIFHIYTQTELDPQRHYMLAFGGGQKETGGINVLMRGILDQFHYTDWLGHRWYATHSEFKLWAPTATHVQVALYSDLNQAPGSGHYDADGGMRVLSSFVHEPAQLFDMTRNDQGVWSASVPGDWADGTTQWWYMFRVMHPQGHVTFAIDPHVTAVSANEGLGAIINDTQRGAPLRGDDNLNFLQRGYKYVDGQRVNVEIEAPPLRVNPVTGNPYQVDHIIYELHVRDFSIHPSSGISLAHRGTFMAFAERGTTARVHNGACGASNPFEISLCANENCWVTPTDANGNNVYVATGLDHLIELGVTTVHLLPFYDQRHVNEMQENRQVYNTRHAMNWGFDPQNYNVPEGTYSTDPTIPYLRIQELKAAINAMHNVGIRVVKDVVYNHTASVTDGPFQASVPYYFHRTWCTGMIAGGGSGVGNELACERPMVRQYVVDSLLYWQREFGIDGFRFDLMWLHDIHTMIAAVEALRAVDPTVVIYGEPWAASPPGSPLNFPELYRDSQGNLREAFNGNAPMPSNTANITGNGFAFFNDNTRNLLRGGNRDSNPGFINGSRGGAGVVTDVWRSVRANTPHVGVASESINYISKHDDMVLFDNIAWSLGAARGGIDAAGASNWTTPQFFSQYNTINNEAFRNDPHHMINRDDLFDNNVVRSMTFGTGVILTSQGIPFIHAADSFLRSKRGHENTFNSDDFFNSIRWDQKVEFYEVHQYFMGLIELRRARPAFRMDNRSDINANIHPIFPTPPTSAAPAGQNLLLAFRLGEHAGGDEWRNIFVAYNGADEPRTVNFLWPEPLQVVVDYRNAGVEVLWEIAPFHAVTLPPFSMLVAFDTSQ
ncbi:MAG: alpha-amylase family glycosyl hydrolase [Defluviitaleaceae bacterium]|nr:alpha-amylase family glycosyl hydrolase [Defluviitaleaceae bacterium]